MPLRNSQSYLKFLRKNRTKPYDKVPEALTDEHKQLLKEIKLELIKEGWHAK
jgi:hypothetical protein